MICILRLFRLIKRMRKHLMIFLAFAVLASCKTEVKKSADELQVVDYEGLRPYLNRDTDTLYLVNFWATWCKPCIDEMPYFEYINENYSLQKVKVLLVNLDDPDKIETRVKPFLQENEIRSEVIILDDLNANYWIEQVDSRWSGAIPATVFYGRDFREFYEKSFKFQELDSIVKSKL
jgi:thiol-disulfide isomerase/thioredoxin